MATRTATLPWVERPAMPERYDGHRMVAVYVRISADDAGDATGVVRQFNMATALDPATDEPVSFVIFCDNNKSASDGTFRPEFHDLIGRWLPSGCLDEIRVYMQKRLWRLPDEGEDVRRACQRVGIDTVRCVRDGDTSFVGNGRTMARFRSIMDTDYAETISQLARDKKLEMVKNGFPAGGGRRPYGFAPDRMTAIPTEFAILREAITRLLAGETLGEICRDFNDVRHVPTAEGKRWSPANLRNCLRSPRIAGISHHHGAFVYDDTGREVVGRWPAVVDRETWNRLVAVLAVKNPRGKQSKTLLTGLLKCGKCGHNLWRNIHGDVPSYACKGGTGYLGCGGVTIHAAKTEAYLVDALLGRTDKAKAKAARAIVVNGAKVVDVDALTMRKRELVNLFASAKIDGAQLAAGTAAIDEQLGAANDAVARATGATMLVPYLTAPGRLRDEWEGDKLDDTAKRAILFAAVSSVVVAPVGKSSNRYSTARLDVRWAF